MTGIFLGYRTAVFRTWTIVQFKAGNHMTCLVSRKPLMTEWDTLGVRMSIAD